MWLATSCSAEQDVAGITARMCTTVANSGNKLMILILLS